MQITTMPVSFGTMYTFDIESEGVNYVAACFSKTKRGYASDWTVHDMVTFRIDRDNLFHLAKPACDKQRGRQDEQAHAEERGQANA